MGELLRVAVAVLVIAMLLRALRPAWRNRSLALRVWAGVRPRHLLGAAALVVVVLGVAVALLTFVPLTRVGLGSLVGFEGNAVLAPIDEASRRTGGGGLGTPEADGLAPVVLLGVTGFLTVLIALFPWLAYVEERTFREGLEDASLGRQCWIAVRFGLTHLVMLIPVAAALAVGVAGFAYGLVYRRAYRTAQDRMPLPTDSADGAVSVATRRRLRDEAVLSATRLHVVFNTIVVLLVYAGLLTGA